ncbi:ATP-binding protein [Paenibacillus sediminis]|uniref:IstB-like ATP-binding domain-containing protein n=1 Tax=Paenibacillus sediminis TaxID=664909 RepID=A0ABS4H4C3_9BACL|nr:hypothetical protein [Paenibacillus sediminis]
MFTHLSLRAGRKSTIITTNLSFERWGEVFQDPIMTAAMIDRLTHQSYINRKFVSHERDKGVALETAVRLTDTDTPFIILLLHGVPPT